MAVINSATILYKIVRASVRACVSMQVLMSSAVGTRYDLVLDGMLCYSILVVVPNQHCDRPNVSSVRPHTESAKLLV